MTLELALRLVGASHIVLALAHLPIARRLAWSADLAPVSLLTRQVFWSHTYFLCVVLAMMGALALLAPETLLTPTPLGRWVTIGLTGFWSARLVCQWSFFAWSHWRGKRFETAIHVVFSTTWVLYVVVYALAVKSQWAHS